MAFLDEVGLAQVWSLIKDEDNKRAKTETYTATVGNNWTESDGYAYQDVSVSGIRATDNPIVDINPGSDNDANELYSRSICKVFRIATKDGCIRLWATDPVSVAFPIQLKVVR